MKNDKLVNQLNQNLADVQVLYVKLHNYHWNVKGAHFFGIHNVTEGYYDYFAKQYDDIAEWILQIGSKPLTTMKEYLVNVREVHVQPVLVKANSMEEALAMVDTASENYCDYPLEYSHLMDKQFWTVEENNNE